MSNKNQQYKDLAPSIHRQRLVIEGVPKSAEHLSDEKIKAYLSQLSKELDMVQISDVTTHRSDKYGEAAWIHWETSGAHFYAWEQPILFFSVDIYTCKAFKDEHAVEFTKKYFGVEDDKNITYKSF